MTVVEIQPNLNGDCATLIYRAKEAVVREQLHEIRKTWNGFRSMRIILFRRPTTN